MKKRIVLALIIGAVTLAGCSDDNLRVQVTEASAPDDVMDKTIDTSFKFFENIEELMEALDTLPKEGRFVDESFMMVTNEIAMDGMATNTKSADFGDTNTQVEGVDEGDVIKNDGRYIYYTQSSLKKLSIFDSQSEKVIGVIDFKGYGIENVHQTYVDGDNLILLASIANQELDESWRSPFTSALIFDLEDKSSIKLVGQAKVQGNLIDSRLKDGSLYFVASEWLSYRPMISMDELPTPQFATDTKGVNIKRIPIGSVGHFGNLYEPRSFVTITSFNIENFKKDSDDISMFTILGSADTLYMSEDLYIVNNSYFRNASESDVYKFKAKDGLVEFQSSTTIPGSIINQYSLDAYEDHFRIATTTSGMGGISNSLFVLDENLKLVGHLKDMAKDESIYAVRFMGDIGYIVTFKQVDPLFSIDLKDPKNPKIIGELEIPGFSEYLHPISDKFLIGVGRDVVDVPRLDSLGNMIAINQRHAGLKISLFDKSDPTNVKEAQTFSIGGRFTSSPAEHNPRSVMVHEVKNILAIPIISEYYNDHDPINEQLKFVGVLVLKLKGDRIVPNYLEVANSANIDTQNIRSTYIGDNLYVFSDNSCDIYDLESTKLLKEVKI